jgi:hypothetical protein
MQIVTKVHVRAHPLPGEHSPKKILIDTIVILFFLIVVIPSLILIAARDSLPTDKFYPAKRYFEQVVLFFLKNNQSLRSEVSVLILERRFGEADRLLIERNSASGLEALNFQAQETTKLLISLPRGNQRVTILSLLSETLSRFESALEEDKVKIITINGGRIGSLAPVVSAIDQTKSKLSILRQEAEAERNRR